LVKASGDIAHTVADRVEPKIWFEDLADGSERHRINDAHGTGNGGALGNLASTMAHQLGLAHRHAGTQRDTPT
jgi:hypothetical protein